MESGAFLQFGLPTDLITLFEFVNPDKMDVFSFGRPPVAIDFMTAVKGLEFENALLSANWVEIEPDLKVRVISLRDLIAAKMASGRYKDLDDIQNLSNL